MYVLIGKLRRINLTMIFSRGSFNRLWFVVCIAMLCYFLFMDVKLYHRIRENDVRSIGEKRLIDIDDDTMLPCDVNPLCAITVKGLMLDYPNYYILGPLAALLDHLVGISCWSWITPNAISISHIFIAIASAKFISMKSLVHRRIGVILFQLRSWMDDLDGLVARKRSNVIGEHSSIGTSGYIVDGVCDALGTIALLTGLYQYIRWHSPVHAYDKLQAILPHDTKNSLVARKIRVQNIAWSIIIIAGSLAVSSLIWNRHLCLYQDLLENDIPNDSGNLEDLHYRQNEIFRSNAFWLITTSWRFMNPHALVDFLLIAVFFDFIWEYMESAKFFTYAIIIVLAYSTEFYYRQALIYVNDSTIAHTGNSLLNVDLTSTSNS